MQLGLVGVRCALYTVAGWGINREGTKLPNHDIQELNLSGISKQENCTALQAAVETK